MFHPADPPRGEPWDDDDFQFLELANTGVTPLNLVGIHLTNGIEFTFTTSGRTNLNPGEHVVLVKNATAFSSRYPNVTNVAGVFTGTLSHSGQSITLRGAAGETIDSVTYRDETVPTADGFGFSLVPDDRSSVSGRWRSSTFAGGSPGAADPASTLPKVVVNEVWLSGTNQLAIELHNSSSSNADISGWFLSAERSRPASYQFPAGAFIPAGGYMVITNINWATNLQWKGDSWVSGEITLFSALPSSDLTGYADRFTFAGLTSTTSAGRVQTSLGPLSATLAQLTSGASNSAPRVGPIVFNELRFDPAPGSEEFIELRNASSVAVPLHANSNQTWRLVGADFSFTFPPEVQIAPRGFVLLVGSDPVQFRKRYGVPLSIPVLAFPPRTLKDSGEPLRLQKLAGTDPTTGAPLWLTMDEINFTADLWRRLQRTSASLEKTDPYLFSNEPLSWRTSYGPGSPGFENLVSYERWVQNNFTEADRQNSQITSLFSDPDSDQQNNFAEYLSGTNPLDPTSHLFVEAQALPMSERFRLRVPVAAERAYTIEHRSGTGPWTIWTNIPPAGSNGWVEFTSQTRSTNGVDLFRVKTPWTP
jgi:hypothetical protein